MTHCAVLTALWLVSGPLMASAFADGPKQPDKPSKNASAKIVTLTGCVDEQNGQFVLEDDRSLAPIANLDGNGVPPENLFAKHLGHKVTVRGTSVPGGNRPTIKVRDIQLVSEMCAPQTPQ